MLRIEAKDRRGEWHHTYSCKRCNRSRSIKHSASPIRIAMDMVPPVYSADLQRGGAVPCFDCGGQVKAEVCWPDASPVYRYRCDSCDRQLISYNRITWKEHVPVRLAAPTDPLGPAATPPAAASAHPTQLPVPELGPEAQPRSATAIQAAEAATEAAAGGAATETGTGAPRRTASAGERVNRSDTTTPWTVGDTYRLAKARLLEREAADAETDAVEREDVSAGVETDAVEREGVSVMEEECVDY